MPAHKAILVIPAKAGIHGKRPPGLSAGLTASARYQWMPDQVRHDEGVDMDPATSPGLEEALNVSQCLLEHGFGDVLAFGCGGQGGLTENARG